MESSSPTPYELPQRIALIGLDDGMATQDMDFRRVLFLDFDGVLHPETCERASNFCCVPNFCDVLRLVDPDHRIPIVISSMWRHYNTLESMRDAFPQDIACQIVGVTSYMSVVELKSVLDWVPLGGEQAESRHRQREILMWMRDNAPAGEWLAIDDRAEYFFDACPNLFLVPRSHRAGAGGITSEVAFDLLARLRKFLTVP